MRRLAFVTLILAACSFPADARKAPGYHYTRPYTRKDGTYVSGYHSGHGATLSHHTRSYTSSGGGEDDGGSFDPGVSNERIGSGPKEVLTYPQSPNLEPSWIRQQRLEKSLNNKLSPDSPKLLSAFSGICTGVTSGDSIEVQNGKAKETVYLYGAKAPLKSTPFFEVSRVALSSITLGKTVTIYPKVVGSKSVVSAWVFLGARSINNEQIKKGFAGWNKAEAPAESKLTNSETLAKNAHAGIWK